MGGGKKETDLVKNESKGWAYNYDSYGPSLMPPDFDFNSLENSSLSGWLEGMEPFFISELAKVKAEVEKIGMDNIYMTYPTSTSKHYKKAPKNINEVRLRINNGGIIGPKTLSQEEKDWCNIYMIIYGQAVFSQTYDDHAKKEEYLHPRRKRIVDKALSMNGSIISERPDGNTMEIAGRNIDTNVGGEKLVKIFETIAPHKLTGQSKKQYEKNEPVDQKHKNYRKEKRAKIMDSKVITAGNTGRESWCGIFAFWIQDKAGNGKTMWEPKLSTSDEKHNFLSEGEEPKPGDICYSPAHNQHYGTIIGVEGDNIISIDGNSAPSSGIWLQTRPKNYWQHFIRALPKNEDSIPYL